MEHLNDNGVYDIGGIPNFNPAVLDGPQPPDAPPAPELLPPWRRPPTLPRRREGSEPENEPDDSEVYFVKDIVLDSSTQPGFAVADSGCGACNCARANVRAVRMIKDANSCLNVPKPLGM